MLELIYLVDDFEVTVDRILLDEELEKSGLTRKKVAKSLRSFLGDEIACSVFLKKYALKDEDGQILELTLDEAKDRWALEVASPEASLAKFVQDAKDAVYFRELYEYFLPGGRQMFALGNRSIRKASYTNCYATSIEEDSIEGIFDTAKKIARTYSYGGGIGFCMGQLRPRAAKVSNTARHSTGSVSFMNLYSLTTGLIGQEGRRGALMLTMPVNHPDVEDFIEVKHKDNDSVRFANISVKITDAFMQAVLDDTDFELSFETQHEIFRKVVKARELWQKLIQSARDKAEPGLLFWDRIVQDSPTDVYEQLRVVSTNPCGELPLHVGGTCVLGSLLLHRFVKNPFTPQAEFDFALFDEMTDRAVRHLDNVVELNFGRHPLAEQESGSELSRRIGLGITGLADMLAALGLRYDSQEALDMTNRVMSAKMNREYKASIQLARERGAFPLFDSQKHYERGFCSRLPEDIKQLGKAHGQRNAGISTVAPNGSLSIIAQCSGGIEPIFALSYTRYVELGQDRKAFTVYHPGTSRFRRVTKLETLPDFWVSAHQVDYRYRIRMQGLVQKFVDASISSTINLPRDVSAETVGQIYIDAWKEGLKGVTVYREGSREGILITDTYEQALRDAGMMDTIVQCVRAEGGDKFYIMTSYRDRDIKKPYQVFVLNYKQADRDSFIKISNGLIRMLKSKGVPDSRINKYIERSKDSLAKLTRFLSLSMKTNNLEAAVEILNEHAFAGTLASRLYEIFHRSLTIGKAVCKNCQSSNVRTSEGCITCLDCNWSGCGG